MSERMDVEGQMCAASPHLQDPLCASQPPAWMEDSSGPVWFDTDQSLTSLGVGPVFPPVGYVEAEGLVARWRKKRKKFLSQEEVMDHIEERILPSVQVCPVCPTDRYGHLLLGLLDQVKSAIPTTQVFKAGPSCGDRGRSSKLRIHRALETHRPREDVTHQGPTCWPVT